MSIYGRDVLEILALVESKTLDPQAQLTLLSSAISMVAMHNGVPLSGLRKGVTEAYRQTLKIAPNFARASGASDEH
jgi:hypothetical protein